MRLVDLTRLLDPTTALWLPFVAPLVVAVLAGLLPWRITAWLSVLTAVTILASAIVLAPATVGGVAVTAGPLRADALTTYMLIAVGAVATVACLAGVTYLSHEVQAGRTSRRAARLYLLLVQLFLACMAVVVLADNLGLVWVAIEATTIVTAFLVGHQRTRSSVEAAWKYVVLCSVGIAIALLGTVCVYASAVGTGAHGVTALDWTYLSAHTAELDPDLFRLATGLVLLGFGTKAGLAPMHAWLPDAHSQAPAPVSALMSGVLLSVSFYAILRYKTIADPVLGPGYAQTLLLVAGLASLALAAVLLIAQRDYKRMLAYSSIEHMGIVALGTAIGGRLALTAVLLHILGHGLAKAVAFCGAGRILQLFATVRIAPGQAVAARAPSLAVYCGLAVVALLGMPPFPLFASELGIARAGLALDFGWAIGVALVLVLVCFVAISRHTGTILLGSAPGSSPEPAAGRLRGWTPLALGLLAAAVLGIWLGPLQQLLDAAAHIAGGN